MEAGRGGVWAVCSQGVGAGEVFWWLVFRVCKPEDGTLEGVGLAPAFL